MSPLDKPRCFWGKQWWICLNKKKFKKIKTCWNENVWLNCYSTRVIVERKRAKLYFSSKHVENFQQVWVAYFNITWYTVQHLLKSSATFVAQQMLNRWLYIPGILVYQKRFQFVRCHLGCSTRWCFYPSKLSLRFVLEENSLTSISGADIFYCR